MCISAKPSVKPWTEQNVNTVNVCHQICSNFSVLILLFLLLEDLTSHVRTKQGEAVVQFRGQWKYFPRNLSHVAVIDSVWIYGETQRGWQGLSGPIHCGQNQDKMWTHSSLYTNVLHAHKWVKCSGFTGMDTWRDCLSHYLIKVHVCVYVADTHLTLDPLPSHKADVTVIYCCKSL